MSTNLKKLIPNKPLFLFDIDGTLTEPRLPMSQENNDFFLEWAKNNNVIFVTGSDIQKILQQLPYILDDEYYIFCCMGNELRYNNHHIIYSNDFHVPPGLKEGLLEFVSNSDFALRAGRHLEFRPGMLNFSVVGRDANQDQRNEYFNWDVKSNERKQIVNYINDNYSDLEAAIGGQISIDIFPKGNDKSQVIDFILNYLYPGEIQQIVFFGDKTEPGGNDYSIIKKAETCEQLVCHSVKDCHETLDILKNSYFSP
jgi:phosphomannomutase